MQHYAIFSQIYNTSELAAPRVAVGTLQPKFGFIELDEPRFDEIRI